MDFKNKNLKLYNIIKGILGGIVIVLSILHFITNAMGIILNSLKLFYIIFMILIGVEEVVFKKNKIGYLFFLVAVVVILTFI